MFKYSRKVKYYETDMMSITHHSNYLRWMEEARMEYFRDLGWGYEKLEEDGVICPVVEVKCRYLQTTTFPEEVVIEVKLGRFNGARLICEYEIKRSSDGELVNKGHTEHCFVDKAGKIVNIKRAYPDLYEALVKESKKDQATS
ncbi:MAG: acyl-CoA thioesterase [Firmicutes bacterium]|nr:acyl-CoA thioesterase [Bacillota bacterium]